MRRPLLPLLALASAACSPAESGLAMPLFDPDGDFFDAPWPSDARTHADGTLDLSGFPNPFAVPLLDTYTAFAEQQVGFGTNAPIYFRFDSPLDLSRLPSSSESMYVDSGLALFDVDPESPYYGERFPVEWAYTAQQAAYAPSNLLSVVPVHGFPLRPHTTYALVITTAVASVNPDFAAVAWDDDAPGHAVYEPLEQALFWHDLAPSDVAIATVFTTTDPLDEMRRMTSFLKEDVAPPVLDRKLARVADRTAYTYFKTSYYSPVFTHGTRPYLESGGQFEFRPDGKPKIASWDDMRLAVCTPKGLKDPPKTGWPVVIWQDGTGGDFDDFCSSDYANEVARRLGEVGIIGLGIDEPLNGIRTGGGPENDFANFNITNPDSAVTNFRQGALDAIYLAHALHAKPITMTADDGTAIPLDPDRIYAMGHSQGGLTMSLAGPFFGEDVKGLMLSGAGGVLAITIAERKVPYDFAVLISNLLQFGPAESVNEDHPVVGLIQTLVERTDPANYAPYWFSQPADWQGQTPKHVLLTSGTEDEDTPYRTAEALAAAARMPLLSPAASRAEGVLMRGLGTEMEGPLSRDVVAFDGSAVTASLAQYDGATHFVIFDWDVAADQVQDYLKTMAAGDPTITRYSASEEAP